MALTLERVVALLEARSDAEPAPAGHTPAAWAASSGPVDVAAMADSDHMDHKAGADDLVEDPVVADAHPVHGLLA